MKYKRPTSHNGHIANVINMRIRPILQHFQAQITTAVEKPYKSTRLVVLNLWSADPRGSVTPTQGVRDFLVAPISHYDLYILKLYNLED
jgi:hypothetical protein